MTDILVKVVDAYVYRKAEDGLLFLILKRAETKIMNIYGREWPERSKQEKQHRWQP